MPWRGSEVLRTVAHKCKVVLVHVGSGASSEYGSPFLWLGSNITHAKEELVDKYENLAGGISQQHKQIQLKAKISHTKIQLKYNEREFHR